MTKRTHWAQYFADDKDIYDLLVSAKRGLSTAKLQRVARARGIYLPNDLSREDLIKYLRTLPFSWPQIVALLDASESVDRTEKLASRTIASAVSLDLLEDYVEQVRDARTDDLAEVYTLRKSAGGLRVEVEYTEMDNSKTRLFQRRKRHLTIEVVSIGGGFRFRHEANQRAGEIVDRICQVIETETKVAVAPRKIELTSITDPAQRTQFFLHLMANVKGFRLDDVGHIKLARMDSVSSSDDEEDEDDDEQDADADDDQLSDEDEKLSDEDKKIKKDIIANVRSAAFKGDNLLQSELYQSLKTTGFFLSHVTWSARETAQQGRKVIFEGQFGDTANARDFRYRVRGVYKRTKDGDFTRMKISSRSDTDDLLKLLEDAAGVAAEKLDAAVPEQGDDPQAAPSPDGDGAGKKAGDK